MECPQIEKLIEDYVDGELEGARVQEIEAHLESCTACSRLVASLRREDRIYEDFGKGFSNSLEIAPSMWNSIRRAMRAEPRPGGPFAGLLSAFSNLLPSSTIARQVLFASVLIIVTIGATLLVVHRGSGSREIAAKSGPGDQKRDLQSALLSIKKAEQQYIEAIQTLSGMIDERKSSLDPNLVAELDRNLKTMDEAIASAQKAYHAHPVDPELAQYMLRAYQKKVELLQDLALRIT